MSNLERCSKCGATSPVVQNGHCGGGNWHDEFFLTRSNKEVVYQATIASTVKVTCSVCHEEIPDGSVHSHTCAPYLLKLIKELQAEVIQLHDDTSSLERELVYLRSDLI